MLGRFRSAFAMKKPAWSPSLLIGDASLLRLSLGRVEFRTARTVPPVVLATLMELRCLDMMDENWRITFWSRLWWDCQGVERPNDSTRKIVGQLFHANGVEARISQQAVGMHRRLALCFTQGYVLPCLSNTSKSVAARSTPRVACLVLHDPPRPSWSKHLERGCALQQFGAARTRVCPPPPVHQQM